MKVKKEVVAEVRQYARERDAIFDKTKNIAEKEIRKSLFVDDILASPEMALKKLFARVGVQVVQKMMPEAKKAGTDHAERLQSINDLTT
jgi:hypothetical protein